MRLACACVCGSVRAAAVLSSAESRAERCQAGCRRATLTILREPPQRARSTETSLRCPYCSLASIGQREQAKVAGAAAPRARANRTDTAVRGIYVCDCVVTPISVTVAVPWTGLWLCTLVRATVVCWMGEDAGWTPAVLRPVTSDERGTILNQYQIPIIMDLTVTADTLIKSLL